MGLFVKNAQVNGEQNDDQKDETDPEQCHSH
jgi:hypothetical protein